MGRISQVIYKKVTNCSREQATKSYWFQNILDIDHSVIDEYEEYENQMKKVRNDNIIESHGKLPHHLCPMVDTTIIGASIKGGVSLVTEIQ